MFIKHAILWTAALVALGSGAVAARAEDRYYLVVLSSQGEPNLPRLSHTFAVFVKASGEGDNPKNFKLETHTISWLPKSLNIQPLRLTPEAGHNFDLPATLKWANGLDAKVALFGPFPIKKDLYEQALQQINRLEKGKLDYIALDRLFRGKGATNCIHAVSDLDVKQPPLDTGTAYGEAASRLVVRHLASWIIPSKEDVDWLRERLELKKYEVRPPVEGK